MNYAIISFGSTSYHALKSISTLDPNANITIYSNKSYPPYHPMLTTYYAVGKINYMLYFLLAIWKRSDNSILLHLFKKK